VQAKETEMKKNICCFLLILSFSNNTFASTVKNAKDFFRSADIISAKLSPDGAHVAAIRIVNETQQLVLIDSLTNKVKVLLKLSDFTQKESSLRGIVWLDNNNIGAQYSELNKGVERLVETRKSSFLLIIQIPDSNQNKTKIRSVRTSGWLVDPLSEQKNVFLYAKSSAYSKVYKLKINKLGLHNQKRSKLQKIDGGQFKKSNEITSVSGFAVHWFFNDKEYPVAVLKYNFNGDLSLSLVPDKKTKANPDKDDTEEADNLLKKWTKDNFSRDSAESKNTTMIMPVSLSDEENTFYGFDFFEDEQRSVYKINYLSDKKELVFESASYIIVDLILSKDRKLIGVKILKNGSVENVFLNENVTTAVNKKNAVPDSKFKSLVSVSSDLSMKLYYEESHSQPGEYILQTKKNQRVIGSVFPHLSNKLQSTLIEGSITQDELQIPYLLTMPKTNLKTPTPLIVMPHGGPIGVFDDRYFNLTTQFFVANGFAVLRVNFRGSSGQSLELKKAGKKQWGDKMLTDIYYSTIAVSNRKDIDANKICVFGMSYGGYAAAMLTIDYPDTFQCAVDVAGVSDINLYLNATTHSKSQDEWMIEQIGDPVADYQKLKDISPVFNASKLKKPILIMHGEQDDIVDIEHSYRLKRMLEKFNKSFEWQVFPEEKHGGFSLETQVELYSKALKFINRNLR
jgi:dipeptidyl aminopeptidase/acylaminoacyl peptidase